MEHMARLSAQTLSAAVSKYSEAEVSCPPACPPQAAQETHQIAWNENLLLWLMVFKKTLIHFTDFTELSQIFFFKFVLYLWFCYYIFLLFLRIIFTGFMTAFSVYFCTTINKVHLGLIRSRMCRPVRLIFLINFPLPCGWKIYWDWNCMNVAWMCTHQSFMICVQQSAYDCCSYVIKKKKSLTHIRFKLNPEVWTN